MAEEKVITAEPDNIYEYAKKAWKFRSLAVTFAVRDIKIKYNQTWLGVLWVLVQPIPMVLIFSFFFGKLIHVDTGKLPYPVFALIGIVGWNYFSNLTVSSGTALIESQSILKKIYFPKIIPLLSKVLFYGLDYGISLVLILVVMAIYGIMPGWEIIFLPLFLFLNILTGITAGLWISALSYKRRDVLYLVSFIITVLTWLTPVFYPSSILPPKLSFIMYANPMALVLQGYRSCLSGEAFPIGLPMLSLIPLLLFFVLGLLYFRRVEDEIADFV